MTKMRGWAPAAACLLLLAGLTACPARIPTTWFKHIGGDADDGAYAVARTQGGYVVAGFVEREAIEDDNALLMKIGPGGRVLWRVEFGDDREDRALAVAEAPDGGFVVAGEFGGAFDPTSDGFLIKTDAKGAEQWRRLYDSGGHDSAVSVASVSGGGYLVGVQYDLLGESKAAMVRTAADGTPLWELDAGPGTHIARAVTTSDGGGALAYWALVPGDMPGEITGEVGIVKAGPDGSEAWRKVHPVDVLCEIEDIRVTPDGGFVLAGQYDFMHEDSRVLLWKTDANGEIEWQQAFGRGLRDIAHAVRPTADGGYILVGSLQPERRQSDLMLTKTDSYGNVLWERAFGGDDLDEGFDVIESGHGYVFVGVGESFEKEGEPDHKQIVIGKTDRWGHTPNGQVPLPEPPEVKPEHYELLSFIAGSHSLTPHPEDPEKFTLALLDVAEDITRHRVLPPPDPPEVRYMDGTPWGQDGKSLPQDVLGHDDAIMLGGTLRPIIELTALWDDLGFDENPPEAGLLMSFSGTDPELMYFRLSNPRYDEAQDRLLFDGDVLNQPTAPELELVDEGRIADPGKDRSTYLFVAEPVGVLELSDADFAEEVLESTTLVVVHFWAEWSGPCRMMAPYYEELSRETAGVKFFRINVDVNPVATATYDLRSVPTFVAFRNGLPVDRLIGAVPKGRLKSFIESNAW